MNKIILASRSPRRKQLLEWAEVEFDIIAAATDESFPGRLLPGEAAIHIARNKALAVQAAGMYKKYEPDVPVLAADTIVVCEGKIIGKPATREDAIRILHLLSGKKHEVITGVAIISGKEEK